MEMAIRFPNLGIDFGYVGNAIQIYGITISYFGILIALSMLFATYKIVISAKRTGQNPNHYLRIIILGSLGALIGARILYLLFFLDEVKKDYKIFFRIQEGGFALYGAILGGMLLIKLYCIVVKISFAKVFDTVCMSVLGIQIMGKMGAFFNRECFGGYTDNLFAMQIPLSWVKASQLTAEMQKHLAGWNDVKFVQVHPAFLYECIWCLFLLFILKWYRRRKKFDGELAAVYLLGYSAGRIWLENYRVDSLMLTGIKIPVFQIVSAVLSVLCLLYIIIGRIVTKKRKQMQTKQNETRMPVDYQFQPEDVDEKLEDQGEIENDLDKKMEL